MSRLRTPSETSDEDPFLVRSDLGAEREGETLVSAPRDARDMASESPGSEVRSGDTPDASTLGTPRKGRRAVLTTRNVLLAALFAVGGVLLVLGASTLMRDGSRFDQPLVHYTVRRGSLRISVTDRGNLQSQDDVKVVCDVDDIEGDGIRGTPILWVIPNGSSVKEGDLLVELDVSNHQERLDRQILDTERARAEAIKAKVQYENQKTQNQTSLAEAELQVELAKLALQQFEDEEGGTFQIGLQDVELQIQEAQSSRLIEQTNLEGVEQLYKLGYRSRGELAEARLSALRAERQLASALSKKREMVEYQYRKMKLELEGALASAERNLEQVKRDNKALLEQARAAMEAEERGLTKEEERLARYREQVEKAKIYAPQDGMVAYHVSTSSWRRQEIRAGATLYPKQTILTIPNLQRMQVETAVHESVLDEVIPGLRATVRVDAFPERSYEGTVYSVAVLPDQDSLMSSNTKVYETIVTIDEEVQQLKPGMTAVVEILVDELDHVLSVPVQAILQVESETWCYVDDGGRVERRPVDVGRTNDRFVEIRSGIEENERVILNPMAILDETKPPEFGESSEQALPRLPDPDAERPSEPPSGSEPAERE